MKLSPTEIFKGKSIFFIGGTGFVGKVTLSMLLHNFPDIGKVYATVRARDENEVGQLLPCFHASGHRRAITVRRLRL